jgi:hypothetical protein
MKKIHLFKIAMVLYFCIVGTGFSFGQKYEAENANHSKAQIVEDFTIIYTSGPDATAPAVSSTDLLQTSLSSTTSTGNFGQENSGNITVLRNGNASIGVTNTCGIGTGNTITYILDTETKTSGYSISGIDVLTRWGDKGRINPNVTVYYSLVESPEEFQTLATLTYSAPGSTDSWTKSSVFAGGFSIITGVKAIKFVFGDQQNGFVGYSEIDIFETSAIIPVTGVTVTPTTLSMVDNITSQLTATIAPEDATNKLVTWTSSNTDIATVDLNGLVTSLAPGEVTITATTQNGGFTATCDITVTASGIKKYEAELATLNGFTFNNNHGGYSGTGFVDNGNVVGRYVEFLLTGVPAGDHDISLNYSNNTGGDRTMSLYVNGTKVRDVSFPNLPSWSTWALKVDNVTLNEGNNTIKYQIDNGNTAQINIDYLIAPYFASITTDVSKEMKESDVSVFPNPLSSGSLSIKLPEGATQLSIFDVTGKTIYQEKVTANIYLIDRSVFKSEGVYVVNVLTAKNSVNKKVVVTK